MDSRVSDSCSRLSRKWTRAACCVCECDGREGGREGGSARPRAEERGVKLLCFCPLSPPPPPPTHTHMQDVPRRLDRLRDADVGDRHLPDVARDGGAPRRRGRQRRTAVHATPAHVLLAGGRQGGKGPATGLYSPIFRPPPPSTHRRVQGCEGRRGGGGGREGAERQRRRRRPARAGQAGRGAGKEGRGGAAHCVLWGVSALPQGTRTCTRGVCEWDGRGRRNVCVWEKRSGAARFRSHLPWRVAVALFSPCLLRTRTRHARRHVAQGASLSIGYLSGVSAIRKCREQADTCVAERGREHSPVTLSRPPGAHGAARAPGVDKSRRALALRVHARCSSTHPAPGAPPYACGGTRSPAGLPLPASRGRVGPAKKEQKNGGGTNKTGPPLSLSSLLPSLPSPTHPSPPLSPPSSTRPPSP